MIKTMIVGNGGRESIFADKLSEDSVVNAYMSHMNPTIIEIVENTGGKFRIGNTNDGKDIADFAKYCGIDLAFVNSDYPLEKRVVNHLLDAGIPTVGPTREGAEIEWNKIYAMELMADILPQYTPEFWIVNNVDEIEGVFREVKGRSIDIVVKPEGLTGGKGVKVMGEHLKDLDDAKRYTEEIFRDGIGNSSKVLIVEKLDGIEYTLMALTDGKQVVCAPATYDYPFRLENDRGPGTGGMGSYNGQKRYLPFMTDADFEECEMISQKVVDRMRSEGRHFNGVLNMGIFKTKKGQKFMEFNARFGDPEAMNVLSVLGTSFLDMLYKMHDQNMSSKDIQFTSDASVIKYFVAPEYAITDGKPHNFCLDVEGLKKHDVKTYISSAIKTGKNRYQTVGNSRNVALVALADTIPEAAEKIHGAIPNNYEGDLDYRRDIGTTQNIEKICRNLGLIKAY